MAREALQMKSGDNLTSSCTESVPAPSIEPRSWSVVGCCVRWGAATLLAAAVGSWLVWFAAYVQRQQNEDDIRAACRRVMPDTADRCFDTVVIQRGGVRR
jgi:hypothetical protein